MGSAFSGNNNQKYVAFGAAGALLLGTVLYFGLKEDNSEEEPIKRPTQPQPQQTANTNPSSGNPLGGIGGMQMQGSMGGGDPRAEKAKLLELIQKVGDIMKTEMGKMKIEYREERKPYLEKDFSEYEKIAQDHLKFMENNAEQFLKQAFDKLGLDEKEFDAQIQKYFNDFEVMGAMQSMMIPKVTCPSDITKDKMYEIMDKYVKRFEALLKKDAANADGYGLMMMHMQDELYFEYGVECDLLPIICDQEFKMRSDPKYQDFERKFMMLQQQLQQKMMQMGGFPGMPGGQQGGFGM